MRPDLKGIILGWLSLAYWVAIVNPGLLLGGYALLALLACS